MNLDLLKNLVMQEDENFARTFFKDGIYAKGIHYYGYDADPNFYKRFNYISRKAENGNFFSGYVYCSSRKDFETLINHWDCWYWNYYFIS